MPLTKKPNLALIPSGYKVSKVYSVLPSNGDGDFDFSRGNTATRVNSQGLIEAVDANIPRLDYSDGGCPSLLLEPQRTNYISYSEDFSQWGGSQFITPYSTISPDGTQNASLFSHSGGAFPQIALTGISFVSGADYIPSLYVKSDGTSQVQHSLIVNGVVVDFTPTDEWVRISDSIVSPDTSGSFVIAQNSGSSVPASFYIWGAQLEQGSYPTSYVPTSGSTATRYNDNCNRINIQDYIGQTGGTLFLDFEYLMDVGTDPANDNLRDSIYFGSNTDVSERIVIDNYRSRFRVFVTGSLMGTKDLGFTQISGTALANTRYRLAIKYKDNDFKCYRNGILIGSATGVVNFASPLNSFYFSWYNGTLNNQKRVNDLRIYKTGLTDQELIELTTI